MECVGTFKYLLGKRNVFVNNVRHMDTDELLLIYYKEIWPILSDSEVNNHLTRIACCLSLFRDIKSLVTKRKEDITVRLKDLAFFFMNIKSKHLNHYNNKEYYSDNWNSCCIQDRLTQRNSTERP